MNRQISKLLVIGYLFMNIGCKKNVPQISVPQITIPVKIDGIIEDTWQQAHWNLIRHIALSKQDTIVNEKNISGNFKMLQDSKNCYFLIAVTDNIKYRRVLPKDPYKANLDFYNWIGENDAVKIFIDNQQEEKAKEKPRINQYTFVYHYDSVLVTSGFKSDITNIKFAQSDAKAGYIMEIAIPWQNLNIDTTKAQAIGIQIFIIDNDKRFIEPGIPPFSDSIISWFDTGILLNPTSHLPANIELRQ